MLGHGRTYSTATHDPLASFLLQLRHRARPVAAAIAQLDASARGMLQSLCRAMSMAVFSAPLNGKLLRPLPKTRMRRGGKGRHKPQRRSRKPTANWRCSASGSPNKTNRGAWYHRRSRSRRTANTGMALVAKYTLPSAEPSSRTTCEAAMTIWPVVPSVSSSKEDKGSRRQQLSITSESIRQSRPLLL